MVTPTWTVDDIALSDEQIDACKTIMRGESQFYILTGNAGTGKSLVSRYLKQSGKAAVTATTGKAALIVNGRTIDSEWGFNRINGQFFRGRKWFSAMLASPDIMAIDEASMTTHQMARLIHKTAVQFGKTVVLVGDWAQASPVVKQEERGEYLRMFPGLDPVWPFESPLFNQADVIRLRHVHRQADPTFLSVLNKIRNQVIDEEVNEVMRSRVWAGDQRYLSSYLKLFASNALADQYNYQRLVELCSATGVRSFSLKPTFIEGTPERVEARNEDMIAMWGTLDGDNDHLCKKPAGKIHSDKEINKILSECQLSGQTLAVGAKVVLTYNDPCKCYVNGDTGILQDITCGDDGHIQTLHVGLDRGHAVAVHKQRIEITDMKDRILYWVEGWPIQLGWAMTIHKSQGMTADYVWLDMTSILGHGSNHGLAYVGLSRCKNLEHLYINQWIPQAVGQNPIVKSWL